MWLAFRVFVQASPVVVRGKISLRRCKGFVEPTKTVGSCGMERFGKLFVAATICKAGDAGALDDSHVVGFVSFWLELTS